MRFAKKIHKFRLYPNFIKNKIIVLSIICFLVLFLFIIFYLRTGIFQLEKIDKRDLERWNYQEGIIENSEEFEISGDKNICWILIHGYPSTPDELREIGKKINLEFNDQIYALRLNGHSKTPSNVLNLTLDDWYQQIEKEYEIINQECNKINVLGFSFGGALTLKLAEEKDLNNIYLLNPYLAPAYRWYWIIPLDFYINFFSDSLLYIKKTNIAQINSPEGRESYISYWNFPLQPVANSKDFLENVEKELLNIKESALIIASTGDKTANHIKSIKINNKISSKSKKLILFNQSNHVIHYDYDKIKVINNIIKFEKENRGLKL